MKEFRIERETLDKEVWSKPISKLVNRQCKIDPGSAELKSDIA